MKVLLVTNVSPWPADSGMAMRVQSLVAGLTACHAVTVVTLEPLRPFADEAERQLYAACEEVITVPRGATPADRPRLAAWARLADRVRTLLGSPLPAAVRRAMMIPELGQVLADLRGRRRFDLAIVRRASLAELTVQSGIGPVVVDLTDVETVWLWRALRAAPWYASKLLDFAELVKHWCYEQTLPARFDRVLICNPEDRAFFALRRNVHVVRNGIADLPAAAEEPCIDILFTGGLAYEPNIDAVSYFHAAVWPEIRRARPGATLAVVGRQPVDAVRALHGHDGCEVNGDVADIAPFFSRAAVVVAPVRLGSGTRLKVLEALARGKAVVASRIAIEGLDLRAGVDLEVADTPSEFARACVELLSNPFRRRQLGESGRRRVHDYYGWSAVHADLNRALNGHAAEGHPAAHVISSAS